MRLLLGSALLVGAALASGAAAELRLAQASSPAEQARQRAEEQRGGGATADQSPGDRDDNPVTGPRSQSGTSDQINDLGQHLKTQEKPPVAHAPGGGGVALTPPEDHPQNTTDGGDVACHYEPAGGWFQPVQGVYQDENEKRYPQATYDLNGVPHSNPQLEEIKLGSYIARLPMVAGRFTVLMGVEKYKSKSGITAAGSHSTIVIKVKTNCTHLKVVRFRFRLQDANGETTYYSKQTELAPLLGPPGKDFITYEVHLTEPDGVPVKGDPPFKIKGASHLFIADLVDEKKNPLGLSVYVGGPAVTTNKLKVQFVPVTLTHGKDGAGALADFQKAVNDLADAASKYIPDYFPLTTDGLPTSADTVKDLTEFDPRQSSNPNEGLDFPDDEKGISQEKINEAYRDTTSSRIASQLGAAGIKAGAQRVVAVLRDKTAAGSDWGRAEPDYWGGSAITTKVVTVRLSPSSADPTDTSPMQGRPPFERIVVKLGPGGALPEGRLTSKLVDGTAHELVHTMPELVWKDEGMRRECDAEYHNKWAKMADGERVSLGGDPTKRRSEDDTVAVMGPGVWLDEIWITQCTYAHLIPVLMGRPDPPLILVRGALSRAFGKFRAELHSGYDVMGESDAASGPVKDWALNLRDAAGKLLKAYPITPVWNTAEDWNRVVVPLFVRIPPETGAVRVEVAYRGKVLAAHPLSAAPPSLAIDTPAAGATVGGRTLHIHWTARGPNGAKLLSSVYDSVDDGTWYRNDSFEKNATEADIMLDPKFKKHRIKIVVTDGGRSSEKTVDVRVRQ